MGCILKDLYLRQDGFGVSWLLYNHGKQKVGGISGSLMGSTSIVFLGWSIISPQPLLAAQLC